MPPRDRQICERCRAEVAVSSLFCPMCGHPRASAGADPLVGTLVAERYLLRHKIGQGGSGVIYRAEHVTLHRKVAVKLLHRELAVDDLAVERFRREATTVGEIDNEHIVEVLDFGRAADGRPFLVMELLTGETLQAVLRRDGPLAIDRALDVLTQVGEALMEAHAMGYVHRDLRPGNIFLAHKKGREFVKVLDFGLAKLVEREGEAATTSLGLTFGDPCYMSPEQARGDPVDRRSDIYALGVLAHEMLTGRPPFVGKKVFDVLQLHLEATPPAPSLARPEVPPWLDALVARALAKRAGDRFATVYRVIEAVRAGHDSGAVLSDEAARSEPALEPPPPAPRERPALLAPAEIVAEPGPSASKRLSMAPVAAGSSQRWFADGDDPERTDPDARLVGASLELEAPARSRGGLLVAGGVLVAGVLAAVVVALFLRIDAGPASADPPAPTSSPVLAAADPVAPGATAAEAGATARARSGAGPAATAPTASGAPAASGAPPGASVTAAGGAAPGTSVTAAGGAAPGAAATAAGGAASGATAATSDTATPTPNGAPLADPAPAPTRPLARTVAPGSAAPRTGARAERPAVDEPVTRGAGPPVFDFRKVAEATGGGGGDPEGASPAPLTGLVDDGTAPAELRPPPADRDAAQAEFYVKLGQRALAAGNPGAAEEAFTKARGFDNTNADAIAGLGAVALRHGNAGDATVHLDAAARLAPSSARIQTLRGQAYLAAGKRSEAAAAFKRALKLDPSDAAAVQGFRDATSPAP
jgi:serine/threonine-protein kinase